MLHISQPTTSTAEARLRCCHSQDLHARLQPLLIFFIDAASFVDDDQGDIDARWELYTAVETTAAGHDTIVRSVPSLIVSSFIRSRWQF